MTSSGSVAIKRKKKKLCFSLYLLDVGVWCIKGIIVLEQQHIFTAGGRK